MQQCVPGFRGYGGDCIATLGDPKSIMSATWSILKADSGDEPLVPFVENFCQLVRDLGAASATPLFANMHKATV